MSNKLNKTPDLNNRVFDQMNYAAADKTGVKNLFGEKVPRISKETIHNSLMAAGFTPGLGNIADAADALLYAFEGEFGDAAFSAAAMIPAIGQTVSAKKAIKAAREAGEEVVTLYRSTAWHPKKVFDKNSFKGDLTQFKHNQELRLEFAGEYGTTPTKERPFLRDLGKEERLRYAREFQKHQEYIPKAHEYITESGQSMVRNGKFVGGEYGTFNPITNDYDLPTGTLWTSTDLKEALIWSMNVKYGAKGGKGSYMLRFEIPRKELNKLDIVTDKGKNIGFKGGLDKKWLSEIGKIEPPSAGPTIHFGIE